MARHGAEHLVVMSRSGYTDEKSQQVLENIFGLDSQIDLAQGDVSVLQDVQRAFKVATKLIGGVIQGAMVLRVSSSKEGKSQPFPRHCRPNPPTVVHELSVSTQDKIFGSMTASEFHEACAPKIRGTWNLHSTSLARTYFSLQSLSPLCFQVESEETWEVAVHPSIHSSIHPSILPPPFPSTKHQVLHLQIPTQAVVNDEITDWQNPPHSEPPNARLSSPVSPPFPASSAQKRPSPITTPPPAPSSTPSALTAAPSPFPPAPLTSGGL